MQKSSVRSLANSDRKMKCSPIKMLQSRWGKSFSLNDVFIDINKWIKEINDQRSYKMCWILAGIYKKNSEGFPCLKKKREEMIELIQPYLST